MHWVQNKIYLHNCFYFNIRGHLLQGTKPIFVFEPPGEILKLLKDIDVLTPSSEVLI